jgi:putative FmdB family regulatory protein
MPFYEYACTNCGATTEILQKISDPPATTCPKCNTEGLTKQISAAGFRLKGGGWYETDFKSGDKRNLVGASSESASADGAKAAAASATKSSAEPAKAAESKPAETKSSDSKGGGDKPAAAPSKPAPAPTT